MAMRVMLRTGLRVSECLSLRPEGEGNNSKRGREVPIPDDLVEHWADLASSRDKDRHRPLFDISRQRVSKSMKEAAVETGLAPGRARPHALRHTYGRNGVLNGVPTPILRQWLGHCSLAETERYVQLAAGHHDWVKRM